MTRTLKSAKPYEPHVRKTLIETRKFSVERREYTTAGDEPIIRDVVVHPGAVVILPILDNGRIVMIRQHRHAVEHDLLELPAGTIEPDEPPIETARRELIEETGYEARNVEPLIEFYTSPGVMTERMTERMYAFIARDLSCVGQNLEPTEKITAEILAENEIRSMLTAGRLHDGKTIAVLGTYFLRAKTSA